MQGSDPHMEGSGPSNPYGQGLFGASGSFFSQKATASHFRLCFFSRSDRDFQRLVQAFAASTCTWLAKKCWNTFESDLSYQRTQRTRKRDPKNPQQDPQEPPPHPARTARCGASMRRSFAGVRSRSAAGPEPMMRRVCRDVQIHAALVFEENA